MEESQEYIINIPICQHIISKEYINNSLNYFPIFSIEAKLTNILKCPRCPHCHKPITMKSLVEVADMTNDVEIKLIAVECLLKKNTEITAQNKQRTQREIDMILGKAVMDINNDNILNPQIPPIIRSQVPPLIRSQVPPLIRSQIPPSPVHFMKSLQYKYFEEEAIDCSKLPHIPAVSRLLPFIDINNEFQYNKAMCESIEPFTKKILNLRRSRGDGNCYYRSVGYLYIERLILNGNNQLNAFYDQINKQHSFFNQDNHDPTIKNVLLGHLEQLIHTLQNNGSAKTLILLHKMFLFSKSFDESLIFLLRIIVANFIELNHDLNLNGMTVADTCCLDYANYNEYREKVVLRMGEEAQDIVTRIMPLVLRIQIQIFVLDRRNYRHYNELAAARTCNLDNELGDGLDLHGQTLSVMLNSGHYYGIYYNEDLNKLGGFKDYESGLICYKPHGGNKGAKQKIYVNTKSKTGQANLQMHLANENYWEIIIELIIFFTLMGFTSLGIYYIYPNMYSSYID